MLQAPPNTVANLAWATSKLGCRDKQLFSHISVAALSGQMQRYTPAQLATIAWAFSRTGHQDDALGTALTAAAATLLQNHLTLQQQQQQQPPAKKGSAAARQAQDSCFSPHGLANVVSSAAGMGWLPRSPSSTQLVQLAAKAAQQEPFVLGFRPMDAANFLWGLATALHSSVPFEQARHDQQQQGHDAAAAVKEGAADSAALDVQLVWQSSLHVTAASLRRVDEAGAGSLCRMVWACAILSGWVRRQLLTAAAAGPADAAAAQQAVAEGSVLFGQLCTAMGRDWQQQPQGFGQSAAMTAWGLIAADKSGLWRLDTHLGAAAESAAAASLPPQQQQRAPPTLLLQRLLEGICASCGKASGQLHMQQQPLTANTVGDLAVALTELKPRVDAYAIWSSHDGDAKAEQQQLQSDGAAVQAPLAVSESSSSSSTGREDSLAVQLQVQMAAAVDALAAAAWQHAGNPGALEVRDVSRMLLAFCQLQVSQC
jgi:hypothetical protein